MKGKFVIHQDSNWKLEKEETKYYIMHLVRCLHSVNANSLGAPFSKT